jgi:hypothetical protein
MDGPRAVVIIIEPTAPIQYTARRPAAGFGTVLGATEQSSDVSVNWALRAPVGKGEADRKRECRAEVLETLVDLYLRLNGYFCIRNYLYHLDKSAHLGLRTESDLLAIRMPHQREVLLDKTIQENDVDIILPPGDPRIDCLIAEVKEPTVEFNDAVRKKDGWRIINSAIEMFGVISPDDRSSQDIARALHQQISNDYWPVIPTSDHVEKSKVSVRMPVFALCSAKHGTKRKFISLEHTLEFVFGRMRPGHVCSPYYRGEKFSPWRATTRRIVDFLDEAYGQPQAPTVDVLLARLCD